MNQPRVKYNTMVGRQRAVGTVQSDPNRRGSPGGSPYHGFVIFRYKSLNISHICRAKLLRRHGGLNDTSFGAPKPQRQDAAATSVTILRVSIPSAVRRTAGQIWPLGRQIALPLESALRYHRME